MLATIPVHPLPEQLTPSPFTVQILVQFLQQTGQLPEPGILWEEQSKAQRSTPQKKMPKRSEVELYTKSNAYSRRGQLHAEVNQQTPYVSGNFLPCYNPCCPLPSLDFTGSCCLKSKVLFPFSSVSSGQAARETN
jgi:hypothetical protein